MDDVFVNFGPIITDIFDQALYLVMMFIMWLIGRGLQWLKIDRESKWARNLETGARNGLLLAALEIRSRYKGDWNVDIKNEMLRMAATYVAARYPDARKKLKQDDRALSVFVAGQLPKLQLEVPDLLPSDLPETGSPSGLHAEGQA